VSMALSRGAPVSSVSHHALSLWLPLPRWLTFTII
jgi:hypothetical protein